MNDGYALMKRYVIFTYICAEVRKSRNRKIIFFRRLQKCAAKFTATADGLNEGIYAPLLILRFLMYVLSYFASGF